MKRDLIDAFTSPSSDPEFGKKYLFAILATVFSWLFVPAILLGGYLTQTLKHSSDGKKGLPEWKDLSEMAIQGLICAVSTFYLLPAALLFAISYLPLMMGTSGFFSLGAALNRFIAFGALAVALGGLAFTLTGIHSYLQTQRFGELFNIKNIISKLKEHSADMSMLLAGVGAVSAGLMMANIFLFGWLGGLLTVTVGAFMSLATFSATGSIFGNVAEAQTQLEAGPVNNQDAALSLPTSDPTIDESQEPEPEVEVWKPK